MELKIDFASKRTIAIAIVLICLLAGILYSPVLLEYFKPEVCTIDGECQHEAQLKLLYELIPVFVLVGIIIGAVVFFFMTSKLDNKAKDLETTTKTLVQFLNKEEKKVVEKLILEKGKVLQSEITRLEGLGKVRSHRILQRLIERGVIEVEEHGKTNIVRFAKPIQEVLIK